LAALIGLRIRNRLFESTSFGGETRMNRKSKVFLSSILLLAMVHLCRGASPEADFESLLRSASGYNFGESRQHLTAVEATIRSAMARGNETSELAAQLAAALDQEGTPGYKDFLCRWLGITGAAPEVPSLVRLLNSDGLADSALHALAQIPGTEAQQALVEALVASPAAARIRVGIINALGQRRRPEAIRALVSALDQGDGTVEAVAAALAKIGGPQAAQVLLDRFERAAPQLRPTLAEACLRVADGLLRDGEPELAGRLFSKVYESEPQGHSRAAALLGMLRSEPQKHSQLVACSLVSLEPDIRSTAILLAREVPGTAVTETLAKKLPELPPDTQTALLRALTDRGDKRALGAVINAAASSSPEVRTAALHCLGALGDSSFVLPLARAAARSTGAEQETARESLARLSGKDVNNRILAALQRESTPSVRAELARSLGSRNAVEAVPVLLKAAKDPEPAVRLEAIAGLGKNAEPEHMPALVQLLVSTTDAVERQEMEKAVVAASRRISDPDMRSQPALAALSSTQSPGITSSLLHVLGRMCGPEALRAVGSFVSNPIPEVRTAAIRALSNWENAEALDLLLQLARTENEDLHRVLAVRGYIGLLGMATALSDGERLSGYQRAMELATSDEERKQALSGLQSVSTIECLSYILVFLDNPALQEEAAAAAAQIAYLICDLHPDETEQAMVRVLSVSRNERTRRLAALSSSAEGRRQTAERRRQRQKPVR
jgi:HEAT repeat protein